MKFKLLVLIAFAQISVVFAQNSQSQEEKEKYQQVITERADKIVQTLALNDESKRTAARDIIRDQYSNLNDIYADRDAEIASVKAKYAEDKTAKEAELAKINTDVDKSLSKLHKKYLSKLSSKLTEEQIEQVKNGMTYSVLPLTYRAYQEEILTLTAEQKSQIYTWLVEAREHAMDAESSNKKHAWFGKYKGRINNYLSAQGYDLKKEGIEWEKRIKAKKENTL
ncbi:DUF3826 domain-containing protein [Pedobacter sp. AW1-32]|uniref:DUF3826 domain-containing protein n=1 Tax=Pedobacter sp. AW1-32 TaxID=3383026 RepID=UPI003FEE880F